MTESEYLTDGINKLLYIYYMESYLARKRNKMYEFQK